MINIICQRDCDPISFPRRKEIVSPVKESTPKGDCDVPPLETPFVSAAVRGPRPPCRVNPQGDGRRKIGNVGGGVPAGQTSSTPRRHRRTYGDERRGDPCGRPRSYVSFQFSEATVKNRRCASYHALNDRIPACAAQAGILLLYGFPAMRRVFF